MKTLIQVEQGYFSYPKRENLLRNINFSIEEGEFAAIIGANGAGKTTFLKLLLGQLSFQKGKVTRNYRQISYVSQAQDKTQDSFPATVLEIVKQRAELCTRKLLKSFWKNTSVHQETH